MTEKRVHHGLQETRPIERDERGQLIYQLYAQDGSLTEMRCEDTRANRMFILWVRQHDRYTPRGGNPCRDKIAVA